MSEISLYEVLEVSKDADKKQIKKAYHKQSKIHHPDKGGSEKKMQEITEAYRILSDNKLRKMYDEGGSVEAVKEEADGLLRRVFAVFEEAMNEHNFVPDFTDLFKIMREKCNEKEQRMDKDIEEVENEIRNIEGIKKRLINAIVFERYLDGLIDANKLRIKGIKEEIDYIRRVLEFISNCEYEVDPDDFEDEKTIERLIRESTNEKRTNFFF